MPPYKTDFSQTINKDTILNLLKEKKKSNETITKQKHRTESLQ